MHRYDLTSQRYSENSKSEGAIRAATPGKEYVTCGSIPESFHRNVLFYMHIIKGIVNSWACGCSHLGDARLEIVN